MTALAKDVDPRHRRERARTTAAAALLLALFIAPLSAAAESAAAPSFRSAHRPDVPGPHGLVSAGHPLAATAGLRMLLAGGTAADAAVATLAALNVVRPQMSGAGGNGFCTVYDSATDQMHSLNATGAAPMALDASKLTPEALNKGMLAGVVPGLFGGWIALLERFGTMSLGDVLAPAVTLAEEGHPLEPTVAAALTQELDTLRRHATSRRVFLDRGAVPAAQSTVRMPDLARTFRKVATAEAQALKQGRSRAEALRAAFDRFYRGDIASEMARFYRNNGGLFTLEDFRSYEPQWTEPVHARYRGFDIYTSPETSRGGLEVLMQLALVERFDLASLGFNSAEMLHLVSEAIKLAKADVYAVVADPLASESRADWLLDAERLAARSQAIDPTRAMAFPAPDTLPRRAVRTSAAPPHPNERAVAGSTDSFSIVDRYGNVIACTPTHGGLFGTGVVVGDTGLTFNNGTRIGSTAPYPEHVNYARGGQIPILNNSPIVVLQEGQPVLAIGTPGGETIGQTQFQALIAILDFGLSIQEAVEAPRLALYADPNFYRAGSAIRLGVEDRVGTAVADRLAELGHDVEIVDGWRHGSMQGVLRDRASGNWLAGADPRRAAYAVGF